MGLLPLTGTSHEATKLTKETSVTFSALENRPWQVAFLPNYREAAENAYQN